MAFNNWDTSSKDGMENKLRDHLNQVNPSQSIKCTHEIEEEKKMPFLNALVVSRDDGTLKMLVYSSI